MVFSHKHSNASAPIRDGAQETVVTTTTTAQQAPGAMINKQGVVTNVMEKPVLQNVIEQKHIEVHHKPVVQEIHEQKIIEIERQNVVQNVQQQAQFSQMKAETRFEEIGSGQISEQERLRLEQLRLQKAPIITQQQGAIQQVQEREVIGQVIRQENIERHIQPVITEVREQNIVQEVLHPVVRKVYEAPIVREVTSTQQPTLVQGIQTGTIQQQGFQQQGFQQQGFQQQGFQQQGFQQGFQQQGYTEKQGLGQKLTGLLHHSGTTGQQQTFQQGEKQGLGQKLTGLLHGSHNANTQQNTLLQNQGNMTTNQWGAVPNQTSGANLLQQGSGMLDPVQAENLTQHNMAVDAVARNTGGTVQQTRRL